MANQTNSFTIAHYILLFLVVALCIGIVAWSIISSRNVARADSAKPVIQVSNIDPCTQEVMNNVAQMWAYNPGAVPEKYQQMASDYADEEITARIRGNCNGVKFTCRPGQIRRDCDPCALGGGRQIAMDAHTADVVRAMCGGKTDN